ncbi:MAG: HDOD domain-containing protein [Gallionella sp.]|nr:HDOD domain-containing protein [Gallionella sp.]
MKYSSDEALIAHIFGSGIQIPPQPGILIEIVKLLEKPNNNLVAIGNLINKDVSLTAAILRMLKSPRYRMAAQTVSMSKAIAILGMGQITNLIKGLSLRKVLSGQEVAFDKFWERSVEIAELSAIIAEKQISACNIAPEQAYMAGLFHDCGVPLLMQRFPDYCGEFRLNSRSGWPGYTEEDKRFSTDHAVVGYLVARHWELPDFICQAVRYHHDALRVDHAALTLVSILQTASHLHARLHQLTNSEWSKIGKQALEEIGVDDSDPDFFYEEVLDSYNHHDESKG